MAARLSGGLPRGPRMVGLFSGTIPSHAPSCLYRHQATMRLSLRRRRVPQAQHRGLHQSRQRPQNTSQGSKVQWFSIPVSVGIGVVGFLHLYKGYKSNSNGEEGSAKQLEQQEKAERQEIQEEAGTRRPKKRPRIRPDGPW